MFAYHFLTVLHVGLVCWRAGGLYFTPSSTMASWENKGRVCNVMQCYAWILVIVKNEKTRPVTLLNFLQTAHTSRGLFATRPPQINATNVTHRPRSKKRRKKVPSCIFWDVGECPGGFWASHLSHWFLRIAAWPFLAANSPPPSPLSSRVSLMAPRCWSRDVTHCLVSRERLPSYQLLISQKSLVEWLNLGPL